MSRQITELELLLQQMVTEHEKLLGLLDAQQKAVRAMDIKAMEDNSRQQDITRQRIAALENRRRMVVREVSMALRLDGQPTLLRIAEVAGGKRQRLLDLRQTLQALAQKVSNRAGVVSKVTSGLLGHLNTVVRILSGAVEQAGLYTKHGVPKVSTRIGVLEAVG